MKNIILLLFLFILKITIAQQIVFTTKNVANEDVFFKVNVDNPFFYENLTDSLNQHASFNGIHKGPICTSHNGNYYIFQSERFDSPANTGGYAAITICNSDFNYFEVPKDAQGNAFHSEGILQIANDGRTIIFVQGGGTHTRDIYKITKGTNYWSSPQEITASLTGYSYYLSPYLSYDETKILFEAANSTYPTTAIQEINLTGTGFAPITSIASIAGAIQVKSPAYDLNCNIYFEAETDAERVWKIDSMGSAPFMVNSIFTNDNSPVTLPDGRLASLTLPNSTHQIKIMNGNGLNDFMITSSSSSFDEVQDIGISAGGNITTGIISENSHNATLLISPNPTKELFSINFSGHIADLKVFDLLGCEIGMIEIGAKKYQLKNVSNGIFILKLIDTNGEAFTKKIIINQ